MAKDTVIDFLRERKKTAEAHADERAAWEGALRDLSKRVQDWLEQPIKEGLLAVEEEPRPASDPVLGKYDDTGVNLQMPDGDRILIRSLGYDPDSKLFRASMWSDNYSILFAWDRESNSWSIADDDEQAVANLKPLTRQRFDRAFKLVLGA